MLRDKKKVTKKRTPSAHAPIAIGTGLRGASAACGVGSGTALFSVVPPDSYRDERACDKALILFPDPQLLFFGCDFYLAAICTFFISAAEYYQAVDDIMRGSRDRYFGRSICFGLKAGVQCWMYLTTPREFITYT